MIWIRIMLTAEKPEGNGEECIYIDDREGNH